MSRIIKLFKYDIKLDDGVIINNKRLKNREGFICALTQKIDGKELTGLGEIAPLSDKSSIDFNQIEQQTIFALNRWQQDLEIDYHQLHPAVACGISMAIFDLNNLLSDKAVKSAPLCYGDPDELYDQLNATDDNIKNIAKMKVGLYEANGDGLNATMLLEAVPSLCLRLEANQAWNETKAHNFTRYLKPSLRDRIEFISEPCKTLIDSIKFCNLNNLNLAISESLYDLNLKPHKTAAINLKQLQQIKQQDFSQIKLDSLAAIKQVSPKFSAIMVKPSQFGSLFKLVDLIKEANKLQLKVVVQTNLESSLGLYQLARFSHKYCPNVMPSLDSFDLMHKQIIYPYGDMKTPILVLNSSQLQQIL